MRRAPLPAALALLAVAAAPALAAPPRFAQMDEALPGGHSYEGGWEHFVGGGVAVFDCNGDGYPEIAAAGGTAPAVLFVNRSGDRPEPGMPDVALRFERAAFAAGEGVTGLWPFDMDGDERVDLAVTRVGENLLLRGTGNCGFERANALWGFEGGSAWSTAFSATWMAGATRPVLAFGNYVDRDDPEGPFGTCAPNMLHRPHASGYVAEPLAPGFCALSMLFSDPGGTGQAQLRISNDRHYYVRGGREQMWELDPLRERRGDDGWPDLSIWGMGIAQRDIDGDGMQDVMLTSMGDQLLMFGRPQGWEAAPYAAGAAAQRPFIGDDGRPSTGWHPEFADVDNDGLDDLFIAKGNVDQMPSNAAHDPNNLLMQRPAGQFTETAAAAGVASTARGRGAALADLDRDGRLDLVVVNRRAPMQLWRNVTRAGGHLFVTLRGPSGNRGAVGARIELLMPDGRIALREITVGGGHGGGQWGPQHFGLGSAPGAMLRVTRPGGSAGPWMPVAAGGDYLLDIGGAEARLEKR
ncbi:FG-GAP repeat domain-containing protein [Profundibacterium mesophilum]|uniref:FG-GAP repeat domain-containing protein n=1 Tax=Profundibacterium mesophilum KAUST100406-0324 TaxID=1037889 RepID=A0A921TG02_9RHOB|nr:VCBS repeat-containing protein [Profundibacterium mesophilum]KAF0676964.1 FG-GAP repeat domain-containing protein [Profundibacterium mesophilum KAUST100406-0324]